MKNLVKITVFAVLLIVLAGCGGSRYKMLVETELKPKPKDFVPSLFVGKIDKSHKTIAIVQSRSYDNKDETTKAIQLEEMQKLARKLGADAVQNIRLLENKAHGFVVDQQVPFYAWKQGEYSLYFLRGDAIIYDNNSDNNSKDKDAPKESAEKASAEKASPEKESAPIEKQASK